MRRMCLLSIVAAVLALGWPTSGSLLQGESSAGDRPDAELLLPAPAVEQMDPEGEEYGPPMPLMLWASLGLTLGMASDSSFPLSVHGEVGFGGTGVRAYVPITQPFGYEKHGFGMEFIHYFQPAAYERRGYVVPFCGGGFWQGAWRKTVELSVSAFAGIRLRPQNWLEFLLQLRGFLGTESQGVAIEAGVLFTANGFVPFGI